MILCISIWVMRGRLFVVFAIVISLSLTLTTQTAFAASLVIVNPSFEDPALVDGDFTTNPGIGIPGWDDFISGGTGVFDPSADPTVNPPDADYTSDAIIPDGDNVAYSNGGFFCQDLSDTLQLNTIYTLNVDVGQRNDAALAGYEIHFRAFDPPPHGLDQETLAGVDSTGVNFPAPPLPGPDSFVTNTVTYETGDSHPRAGQLLRICVIVDGTQTNFDMVSLDASPVEDSIGQGENGGGPNTAIGGELIPIETSMVLVAGSQNTAAWMIPVLVSAIGIGIVIARKF